MKPLPTLSHILKQLPSLDTIVQQYGQMSVYEYAQKNYHPTSETSPLRESRKHEFLALIGDYTLENFDEGTKKAIQESLTKNYCVSTAEHHGPMGHPFFFQSALLRGLENPNTLINFCTSHVSLGNSSYPRGLVFHGDGLRAPTEYLHLPLFPANHRMSPVFRLPSYTRENINTSCLPKLQSYLKNGCITAATYESIIHFLKTYVLQEKILNCATYSKQITQLNHLWWDMMFPNFPKFIPLDVEDIVCTILGKHIHKDTLLSRILTDRELQPCIEKYFDGISCCFDITKKSGTYLFWYLDEKGNRHSLWREGSELVSQSGFRMGMNHEEIAYHLTHNHLIPSGLLVYTTLACYYGITCFGGFSQGDYLPKIQKAYTSLISEGKNRDEENLSTQVSLLNEDFIFLHEKTGESSTALDLYLRGIPSDSKILENAKKMTISSSIEAMLPEIARCL